MKLTSCRTCKYPPTIQEVDGDTLREAADNWNIENES